MFENKRMLDKNTIPNDSAIIEHLGLEGFKRLTEMENCLNEKYVLTKALKFPFGNNYGWGYKYSHKKSHLCYVFFEKDAICVTLQFGDKIVPLLEENLSSFLPKTRELWENRYPCGEKGGWIHYSVESNDELLDVCELIFIKKKPIPV